MLPDFLQESLHPVVFTTESENEHGGGVRVSRETRKNAAGVAKIIPKLGTSVGMGECLNPLDGTAGLAPTLACARRNPLTGSIDAGNGVDDPDLIANGGTAIGAAVSLKGHGITCSGRGRRACKILLGRFWNTCLTQTTFQILRVDMLAGSDGRRGQSDGKTILPDPVSCVHGANGHLVPGWNVIKQCDVADLCAFWQSLPADGNGIE